MLKRLVFGLFVLMALVSVCSCKMEPKISEDDEKTAAAGAYAAVSIIQQYDEKGSYSGVSAVVGDNYTVAFNFSSASITVDLSEIDPSMGSHTILVNGEVVMTLENYPSQYPATLKMNIIFKFAGKNHSLELTLKQKGVSSTEATRFKFDGKEYDPSSLSL